MNKRTGAIVLAAGFSSRFGSSKLLANLNNGKPVFQQTLERISEALPDIIVVTRPEMVSALQKLAGEAPVLSFENAEQGMGATLAYAVRHIKNWDSCLVCLADMPFIDVSTYSLIAGQVTASSIVTPICESRAGNPVAFGSEFFNELASLSEDTGGRLLINLHPGAVHEIQTADQGILQDIDTLEELEFFQDT